MDPAGMVEQLKQHLPAILEGRPVLLAYLYGSVSTGYVHPFSDVDIALVLDPRQGLDPYQQLTLELEIEAQLEHVAGIRDADVRAISGAPLRVQGKVVTQGILLYSRDEEFRIAFEVATRRRYFDFLPVLHMMQQAYLARLGQELETRGA